MIIVKKIPTEKATKKPKVLVTIRVDPDVLDAYKATGDGYQSRMNTALRAMMPRVTPFTPIPKPKKTGRK